MRSAWLSGLSFLLISTLVGAGLLAWCYFRARKQAYGPTHYTMVENSALYWHLVDLIWIYLFPLLYLVG